MFAKKTAQPKTVLGFTPSSYEVLGPEQFAEIIKFHRIKAPAPPEPPPIVYPPAPVAPAVSERKVRLRALPSVGYLMAPDQPPPPPPPIPAQQDAAETRAISEIPEPAEMPAEMPLEPVSKKIHDTRRMVPLVDDATQDILVPSQTVIPPPAVDSAKQPLLAEPSDPTKPSKSSEPRLGLLDYCFQHASNFHPGVVSALLQHMNGMDADPQYKPNVILLTGKSGCGKTFCVRRAVKDGGFDLIEVDSLQIDVLKTDKDSERYDAEDRTRTALTSRPDPFGPNARKRICVALFDAVDGMEQRRRSKITKVIYSLMVDDKSKEKRRSNVTFRPNLVILTADDRYNPDIRDMVYKLKPAEIKVNELDYTQMTSLVESCCEYMNVPVSPRIYRLISSNTDNLGALLTKVESLSFAAIDDSDDAEKEGAVNDSMKVDERTVNIFSCCRTIFQPPEVLNPKTNQREPMGFDRYREIWELGGDKVENILFNSYPNFVHYIPDTPAPVKAFLDAVRHGDESKNAEELAAMRQEARASMKDMVGSDYFYRGVESMAALADMHSLLDALPFSEHENMTDALQLTYKTQMEDVISRNSRDPKIDVTSRQTYYRVPFCLARCRIGKSEMETLRCVQMIRSLEAQRQIQDFTYEPNPEYDLLKHVGVRYIPVDEPGKPRRFIVSDMFEDDPASKSKGKSVRGERITPRLECVKLLTHRFIFTDHQQPRKDKRKQPTSSKETKEEKEEKSPGNETPNKKSKPEQPKSAMIRLSNGQYVERKRK